mmetsp:Transcript_89331/g.255056  ORF Transcript_89331/g.255056 Transcript_89331/m.255056 type:complete len:90 (+) Transcript_89331:414-683(+)
MGGRHEQLTGAVRYFEDQYVQDPSKEKIELLTKESVVVHPNTTAAAPPSPSPSLPPPPRTLPQAPPLIIALSILLLLSLPTSPHHTYSP